MSVKEHNIKLALALIVKGDDEEAERLDECLDLPKNSIDGIFITVTQPNDKVEEVCKKYKAHVSHFEWSNDFSAARNFNFSQVPNDYTHIIWLDADDGIRGVEKLKNILSENTDVDTFILNYMYAFDEERNPVVVHMKTQIVKNNGCVVWRGAIHEDLTPTRDITPFFIEGIERIHLSEGDRIEKSKERNLFIAEQQIKKEGNDPRSWWNLGNSLRAMDRYEESIQAFNAFLSSSQSDEEKYHARLRMSECYWAMGDKFKAIDEARYAIGTKPEYPDAYNLLGGLYIETHQWDNAIKIYLQGLVKKPPYHSILVYNPRDYDYVPMKNLAKAYWSVNRPDMALPLLEACLKIMPSDKKTLNIVENLKKEEKIFNEVLIEAERLKSINDKEKLKKELDKLPIDIQSHPAIAVIRNINFIKEKSSGKDIVFYCGNTGEVWNPETAKIKGIGGSEEAVIWLSKLLVKRGWNVEVYANCGTEEKIYDGVHWKPFWTWNTRDKQDVVIIWRHPAVVKYDINADKIFVDMHDVVSDGEFTEERLKKITKVFVKSKFHRSLFPSIPENKIIVVPNGIDPSIFEQDTKRDDFLLVNTSSPDRSLSALLECYEEIKKQVPEAKLKWAYGWGVWDIAHGDNPRMMEWKDEMTTRMKELGVEELGRVSHGEVAKLYLTANIFAYPSEFAEIDCISLSKALAAGTIPITTDFSAMGEKQGHGGIFVHSSKNKDDWAKPYQFDFSMRDENMKKEFIESCVRFLKNPPTEKSRSSMREWARFNFDWERVADVWDKEIKNI